MAQGVPELKRRGARRVASEKREGKEKNRKEKKTTKGRREKGILLNRMRNQ
jgi:hypothetical protein